MVASEGDGTPRRPASRNEEEEYGDTPASSTAGVSPLQASESSLDRQADDQSPVTRRDLARTRRAIGTSLKSMHEEFTQLLMSTQQECSTRIDACAELLNKDREVTNELIKLESQKREALEEQLAGATRHLDRAPSIPPRHPAP